MAVKQMEKKTGSRRKKSETEVVDAQAQIAPENSARKLIESSAMELDVTQIRASALNPRKVFDQDALQELADSLKEQGMIEPIVVRKVDGGYEIIAGERRWRAAQMASLERVPARILEDIDDRRALELALVENLVRRDINPMEEAEGFAKLRELGWKVEQIAAKVGRDATTISNRTRLLDLPENIREHVRTGELSPSAGKALLPFVDYPRILERKLQAAFQGVPTKQLERLDYDYSLIQQGAMTPLVSREVGVAQAKECLKCKHRRKRDNCDGWFCLDYPCAVEKIKAEGARQEEKDRNNAGAGEDVEIVDLRALGYDKWKRARECVFEDCKACDKQKMGREHASGKPFKACVDIRCFNRLRNANTRLANKARRSEVDEQMKRAHALLDGDHRINARIEALVCFEAIRLAKTPVLNEVMTRRGTTADLTKINSYSWQQDGSALRELHKLAESGELLSLVAELMIAQDAKSRREFEGHRAAMLEFLLQAESEPVGADDTATAGSRDVDGVVELPLGSVWKLKDVDADVVVAVMGMHSVNASTVVLEYLACDSDPAKVGLSFQWEIGGEMHPEPFAHYWDSLMMQRGMYLAMRGGDVEEGSDGRE